MKFSSQAQIRTLIERLRNTLRESRVFCCIGRREGIANANIFSREYRVETLSPPYMATSRPSYSNTPDNIPYAGTFELQTDLPDGTPLDKLKGGFTFFNRLLHLTFRTHLHYCLRPTVSLIDLGFITHSIHMNSRLVSLTVNSISSGVLQVQGPPSTLIYSPGPAWLYLVNDGIPSVGKKVMVGVGNGPPVDEAAIASVLSSTEPTAKERKVQ